MTAHLPHVNTLPPHDPLRRHGHVHRGVQINWTIKNKKNKVTMATKKIKITSSPPVQKYISSNIYSPFDESPWQR